MYAHHCYCGECLTCFDRLTASLHIKHFTLKVLATEHPLNYGAAVNYPKPDLTIIWMLQQHAPKLGVYFDDSLINAIRHSNDGKMQRINTPKQSITIACHGGELE